MLSLSLCPPLFTQYFCSVSLRVYDHDLTELLVAHPDTFGGQYCPQCCRLPELLSQCPPPEYKEFAARCFLPAPATPDGRRANTDSVEEQGKEEELEMARNGMAEVDPLVAAQREACREHGPCNPTAKAQAVWGTWGASLAGEFDTNTMPSL
eukprot:COSAG06_NODE_27245_length_597_cov_0.698795_1_plen_152_part_00